MNGRRAGILAVAASLAALALLALFALRDATGGHDGTASGAPREDTATRIAAEDAPAMPRPLTDAGAPATEAVDQAAAAAAPEAPPGPGEAIRFTGLVVDDAGQPVAGASVMLVPDARTLAAQGRRRSGNTWLEGLTPRDFASTKTGADGRFALTARVVRRTPADPPLWGEPVDPWLVARSPDFAPSGYPCRDITGSGFDAGTLKVARGGTVVGRVVDEHGAPIEGAMVEFPVEDGWGRWMRPPDEIEALLYVGTSDADGRFEVGELPAMRLESSATAPGRRRAGWKTFELAAGERHVLDDLVLPPGATVTGVVLDPDGRPHAGAEVIALFLSVQDRTNPLQMEFAARAPLSAPRDESHAVTGTDGRFELRGLAGANRSLLTRAPGFAAGIVHDVANGADVALSLGVPAVLDVHVVDHASGAPLAATVTAKPQIPPFAGEPLPLPVAPVPDDPGHFVVRDASAAGTMLDVSAPGHARAAATAPAQASGTHGEFTVALDPGFSIAGRVVDASGAPVADAAVTLLGFADERMREALRGFGYISNDGAVHTALAETRPGTVVRPPTACDHDGRFALDELSADRFAVHAAAPGHVTTETEILEIGPVHPALDVVITLPGAGDVRGTVLDAAGAPATRDLWLVSAAGANGPGTASDSAGRFALRDVEPGEWTVHVSGGEPVPVTVVAGQSAEVVLRLEAPCRLAVEVTSGAAPLADASVVLQGAGLPLIGLQTGADGRCETTLPSGKFAVRVDSPRGGHAERSLQLQPGESRTLRVALSTGRIEVEAHVAGTGAPAAGVPLTCALIAAGADPASGGDDRHGPWMRMEPVLTGDDGRGAIEHLEPGRWRVSAGGNGWMAATPVMVEVGEQPAMASLEVRRAPVVRVRVTTNGGTPAPANTDVVLFRPDRPDLEPHTGWTRTDGWFECNELESAGTWIAAVPRNRFDDPTPDNVLVQATVQAVEGQTTEVTLVLPSTP